MRRISYLSANLLSISLALLTVVQVTTVYSWYPKMVQECYKLSNTSQCKCRAMQNDTFDIVCTTDEVESSLTARIQYNTNIRIDCHQKNFSLLPNITIGAISKVWIDQCSLSAQQSIRDILQRLGITQVNTVIFENSQFNGSLSRMHFKGLQDVIDLSLNLNYLTTVAEDSFADLKSLTRLHLRSNAIALSQNIFALLENLTFIELGSNNLQDLPSGIFRNQKKLKKLNLSNNNLTNLSTDAFEGASAITRLDLSENNIVTLPPDVFTSLINLEIIILDGNNFKYLPVGLFSANKYLNLFSLYNNRVPMKDLPAGVLADLPHLKQVILGCGLDNIPQNIFSGSKGIQNITIAGNKLTRLPNKLFEDQVDLKHLDLSRNHLISLPDDIFHITGNNQMQRISSDISTNNNRLSAISVSNLTRHIVFLNVSYNKLQQLNSDVLKVFVESQTTVVLSHNPWICNCTSKNLIEFTQTNYKLFPDHKDMKCENGKTFSELSPEAICPNRHNLVVAVSILICVLAVCVIVLATLYCKYQEVIKVWLYAHNSCLWLITREELNKDITYDAFISYSNRDENFVWDSLLPELENGPTPFSLCLHIQDPVILNIIPNYIERAVSDSRRVIFVLSPSFIRIIWARMEFRKAYVDGLMKGRTRIIFIIYKDIDDCDTLEPDLKAYLQMSTCIKWGDPWFWDKLRYAMPHRRNNSEIIR